MIDAEIRTESPGSPGGIVAGAGAGHVALGPVRLTAAGSWPDSLAPDRFHLVLTSHRDGTGMVELALHDATRPPRPRAPAQLVATFPKSLLPLLPDDVERLLDRRMPGWTGIGAVLADLLGSLARPADYDEGTAERLGAITVDLVGAVLAHELGRTTNRPPRHQALYAQIDAYIRGHLGDPKLSPATIAAAHHISVRHLHSLFHGRGRTVAGLIRGQRLERCLHDLADPLQRASPVRTIAARWGFTDPAHFSRVFRDRYKMSPTTYRTGTYQCVTRSRDAIEARA